MKKILVGVDGTKGSKAVLSVFNNLVSRPEEVILLHVERLEGDSLMIDMLGDAEISTLKESMKGTERKEALDRRAEAILSYYRRAFEDGGLINVRAIVREGNPVDEILKVADEEGVDMVVLGCNGSRGLGRLVSGCVSTGVEKGARMPVLLAKEDGDRQEGKLKEVYAAG